MLSGRRDISEIDPRDELLLAELGYRQELRRNWNGLHNFGISFSIISVITGITTLFSYGLNTGGPAVMTIGWIIVSLFTIFIGFSMAEILSAILTASGPYFWAAALAPDYYAPFVSWFTGWFNFVGQFSVTTSISFGCATLISMTATVMNPSYTPSPGKVMAIYVAVLLSHGLVNSFGLRVLRYLNNISVVLHTFGVTALGIAVLMKAPRHQPASFVFATFYDGTGGWSERASSAYVVVCGLLLSQYTITGFDASAHLSEETLGAGRNAPFGVLMSIGASAVFGLFLLLCLLFSIQDFMVTVTSDQPVIQIFVDVFGAKGTMAGMSLIIICVWFCGLFSLTSNSRMMFAFSRDGALPHFFNHIDDKFQTPIRTVWLAVALAFILSLPSLGSDVAFAAATSIATVALYISYIVPVIVALTWPQHFKRGFFNLGIMSRPVGFVSVAWVSFITIVFCLPQVNPVTSTTLNYTPVALGIVVICVLASWFFWAHKWFYGPRRQITLGDTNIVSRVQLRPSKRR
ncbi:uncharacterized protein PV09_01026 [Verruconis gallopava]|uniref:Amino acid permease/ SLC12A domain-containing protein n=1 Tax=Verruconis gallopava TaxID=253628 RepID=A0A0D1XZ63_9PEZI|nr:uncharacterized protein PV09_01026 [Verruconis gallopava]KIW08086.1 hypothetical protein PV09_01026 [Verruconis gallopava]